MKACDIQLLSEICPNLKYHDLVLCASLANSFGKFSYADTDITFPIGRSNITLTTLIESLDIPHEIITFDELIEMDTFDNIIISLPKQALNLKSTTSVRNIFVVYSAFLIDKIDLNSQHIYLKLAENEINFENKISLNQFQNIYNLNSAPFEYSVKIIKLLDKSCVLRCTQVVLEMKRNIAKCVHNFATYDQNISTVGGPQFYTLFKEKVSEFLFSESSAENNIKSHIFFSCFRSGTFDFFRGEFNCALKNSQYFSDYELKEIGMLLKKSSKKYVDILQLQRKIQKLSSQDIEKKVHNLISDISEIELKAFNNILDLEKR